MYFVPPVVHSLPSGDFVNGDARDLFMGAGVIVRESRIDGEYCLARTVLAG